MSIHFETADPNRLLAAYKAAIDKGSVETWSYDSDGDFTHTPDQWARQAWLRPKIKEKKLLFIILKPIDVDLSTATYAVYHGRFVESFLSHCDKLFTKAYTTAMPADGDVV